MTTLASQAAGLSKGGDLFGLLAAGGQHAFAIPLAGGAGSPTPPPAPGGGGTAPTSTGGSPSSPPLPNTPGPGGTPATPTTTVTGGGAGTGAPPKLGQYDVSSDPVLQQVNAAMALADQNAHAAALRNREQLLLQYGDPALASSILGANDPYVTSAAQNQNGTVQQLGRAYQHGLHDFTDQLDPSLAYSGYRIGQEGQIGQDYTDSLVSAASAIQNALGGVTDNLTGALASDNATRQQALADAYARAVAAALANPPSAHKPKHHGKKG